MINLGDAVLFFKGDMNDLDRALGSAKQNAEDSLGAMKAMSREVGISMTAMGAGISGALALVSREFITFEAAFTGVRKTVDASNAELDIMEGQFKELAKTVPVSAAELAKIGETAGQLGIQKGSILAFTKTIVDLGVSSNLAGEEGATMLARFANIVQLPQDKFQNLGSTIVALGNAGASTEQEIAAMGLRLAGAGTIAGMTSGDILGIANALSSVGIEAEAGGSSISRLIMMISENVNAGGETLNLFAEIAGQSVEQFSRDWKEKPAEAFDAFTSGMGRLYKSGYDVFGILDALGIEEIRLKDAILRTATAGDLMTESIKMGNQAFAENTALLSESQKFYETSAAQFEIMKNNVTDLSIELGAALVPSLLEIVNSMKPVINDLTAWVRLNPELTTNILMTVGAIGALFTVVGPLLVVLPGIVTGVQLVVAAFGLIGPAVAIAAGVISLPVLAIGAAIAAIGLAVYAIWEMWDELPGMLQNVWDSALSGGEAALESLGEMAGWIAGNFVQAVTDPVTFIAEYWTWLGEVFDSVVIAIGTAFDWLMVNVIDPAWGYLTKFYDWISGVFSNAFGGAFSDAAGLANTAPAAVPGMATGGMVARGGLAWVGEQGPELVRMPTGAQVIPAPQSAAMATGGTSSIVINLNGVTIPNRAAAAELARTLGEELQTRMSSRGLQTKLA